MTIKISYKNKPELVQYVNDRLARLKPDYRLTMIIDQGLSEDSYVLTVTEELWEDIVRKSVQSSSEQPTNIYKKNTPVG